MLHLYSIIKAQQNLINDICALLGLMRDFAVGWAYRGGRDGHIGAEGMRFGAMMNWLDGLR